MHFQKITLPIATQSTGLPNLKVMTAPDQIKSFIFY